MDNIRRVWFIDVGSMENDKVDVFIDQFKERVASGSKDSTDAFIPVRPNSKTRVVELGKPTVAPESGVKPRAGKKKVVFLVNCHNSHEKASERADEIRSKIASGEYALPNGDLVIPTSCNADVQVIVI